MKITRNVTPLQTQPGISIDSNILFKPWLAWRNQSIPGNNKIDASKITAGDYPVSLKRTLRLLKLQKSSGARDRAAPTGNRHH